MAYVVRQVSEVKYGQFGAYLKSWKKLDDLLRERGWATSRVLVPTAGQNNEFVAEFEYPDLATFENQNKAFYADKEAFEAYRAGAEFIVQGSSRTEIYEDVPLEIASG